MAKTRFINTRFWHDTFIKEKLNPLDRYLYLYFLTNDKTNICGIYECPVSIISSETGLEIEAIKKMLRRFEGKVLYIDGWVFVKYAQRYQNYDNPKIKIAIEREISEIPFNIKQKIEKIIGVEIAYGYGIDSLSHLTNTNTNTNTNTKESVPAIFPLEEEFNLWWNFYPKKVGKGDALKSWKKIKPSAELQVKMKETINKQKQSEQWKKENGRFIPNPATWLNQGRWDDEVNIKSIRTTY